MERISQLRAKAAQFIQETKLPENLKKRLEQFKMKKHSSLKELKDLPVRTNLLDRLKKEKSAVWKAVRKNSKGEKRSFPFQLLRGALGCTGAVIPGAGCLGVFSAAPFALPVGLTASGVTGFAILAFMAASEAKTSREEEKALLVAVMYAGIAGALLVTIPTLLIASPALAKGGFLMGLAVAERRSDEDLETLREEKEKRIEELKEEIAKENASLKRLEDAQVAEEGKPKEDAAEQELTFKLFGKEINKDQLFKDLKKVIAAKRRNPRNWPNKAFQKQKHAFDNLKNPEASTLLKIAQELKKIEIGQLEKEQKKLESDIGKIERALGKEA